MLSSLQRYIAKELTHFVGRQLDSSEARYSLLRQILRSGYLTHPPHNPKIAGNLTVNTQARISQNEMYAPQVVCLCDIPVQDLAIHIEKYSPFGLSFSKDFIARNGGAPVFYVPCEAVVQSADSLPPKLAESQHQVLLDSGSRASYFDRMIQEYHKVFRQLMRMRKMASVPDGLREFQRFLNFCIFSYLKFFDHRLPDDDPGNFYFEREWRIVGNLKFSMDDVRRVILLEEYAKRFRQEFPDYYGQLTFAE